MNNPSSKYKNLYEKLANMKSNQINNDEQMIDTLIDDKLSQLKQVSRENTNTILNLQLTIANNQNDFLNLKNDFNKFKEETNTFISNNLAASNGYRIVVDQMEDELNAYKLEIINLKNTINEIQNKVNSVKPVELPVRVASSSVIRGRQTVSRLNLSKAHK